MHMFMAKPSNHHTTTTTDLVFARNKSKYENKPYFTKFSVHWDGTNFCKWGSFASICARTLFF